MNVVDYFNKTKSCAENLKSKQEQINMIVDILRLAKETNKQVFICGNGGSAGTATHFAADLFKIAGIKAISLEENVPLMTALINDDGWGELYVEQLKRLYNPGDVLIAISVHGGSGKDKAGAWSQNLNKAISYVKNNEGVTIGFSGFDGGQMKYSCSVCLVVPIESTPIVESFHAVLHHYIAFELQEGDRK